MERIYDTLRNLNAAHSHAAIPSPPHHLPGDKGGASSSSSSSAASGSSDSSSAAPVSVFDLSHSVHMVAGAFAGMAEHTAMFPIDVVKTRIQASSIVAQPGIPQSGTPSIISAIRSIVAREGVRGLWRGVGVVAIGAGPSHALYFASFETVKHSLGGASEDASAAVSGVAGAVGTVISDAILTPADVVKQRLQLYNSPYKNMLDCATSIIRTEGFGALYASYRTTLLMNVPFFFTQFGTYEFFKRLLNADEDDPGIINGLRVHGIAGGISGGVAAYVTTPLDVVKTRQQIQGVEVDGKVIGKMYKGTIDTLQRIYAEEGGVRALFKGWKPRVVFFTPAAAISWASYELSKQVLLDHFYYNKTDEKN